MSTLLILLFVVLGIIAVFLSSAALVTKSYTIVEEVKINASVQKVFDYLRHLNNHDQFNKWAMADANVKKQIQGEDGTVGCIYKWNGNNKVGEGEQEIKTLRVLKKIETEVRIIRPFPGVVKTNFETNALSENQTKVIWHQTSSMKYPMNILIPIFIRKMLHRDIAESLNNLKVLLEE